MLKFKYILIMFFGLLFVNLVYPFQFQEEFLDSSNDKLIFYFDTNYNDQNIKIVFDKNLSYNYLKSRNLFFGLFEDEFPYLNQKEIILPFKNEERRWKLSLKYNNLETSSLKNINLLFYSDNNLIKNISLNNLKYFSKGIHLDLNSIILQSKICSFENKVFSNCGNVNKYLLNNSDVVYIPIMLSNVSNTNISEIYFDFDSFNNLNQYDIKGSKGYVVNSFKNGSLFIFDSNKLKILNKNNLSKIEWVSNYIPYFRDVVGGNFSNTKNSFIYITDNSIILSNTTFEDELVSSGGYSIDKANLFSNYNLYSYSNSDVYDFQKLDFNNNLSFIFDSSLGLFSPTCDLFFSLNKVGEPNGIVANINGNFFIINTSDVIDNSFSANSFHDNDYDSIILLDNNVIYYKNPLSLYPAKDCKIKFQIGSVGDVSSKKINLKIGSNNFFLNTSKVKPINVDVFKYSNYTYPIDLFTIDEQNYNNGDIIFSNNFNSNISNNVCDLTLGLNYYGNKKDLFLNVNNINYPLDLSTLNESSYVNFKSFYDSHNNDFLSLSKGDIKYYSNFTNLNSKTCKISLGLNYKGNKNLLDLFLIGDKTYDINLENLTTDNIEEYFFPDSDYVRDTFVSIGRNNTPEYKDTFVIKTSSLFSDLEDVNSCYLRMNLCYFGSSQNNLQLFFNSKLYEISSSQISSCNVYNDYFLPVNCSELEGNPNIEIYCSNCDNNNYFNFGIDNTSGSLSNAFLYSLGNVVNTFDPMFSVYSNESLNYDVITTNIQCSELEKKNITFSCDGCDSLNDVNFITNVGKNNTYQNNILKDEDILLGIETYESYDYSLVSTQLPCSLILNNSFSLNCPSCDNNNFYTVPIFSGAVNKTMIYNDSGFVYILGTPYLKIISFEKILEPSYGFLDISCSLLNYNDFEISCLDCDNTNNFFLFTDLNSTYNLKVNDKIVSGNLLFEVISNSSLLYSTLSINNLDCNNITGKTLVFDCPSCDDSNYYNFILVNGSSGHSFYNDNFGVHLINDGDFKIFVQSYDNYVGDEFVIVNSNGNLEAYNTNGSLLWSKLIDGFSYRYLYVDDFFLSYSGDEIFFVNENKIDVYSSIGDKIITFNNLNKPILISSENYLFVLNSDLSYNIYNNEGDLVKTGKLSNVGYNRIKLLEANIINTSITKEYILVTTGNEKTYFTIFDNLFNKLYVKEIEGYVSDAFYYEKDSSILHVLNNGNLEAINLAPINNLSINLNDTIIYNYPNYITNYFKTSNLNVYFNSYISSLNVDKEKEIFLPVSFNFLGSDSIFNSYIMSFNSNVSNLISYVPYSGLVSKDRIIVGKSYPINGTKLIYNYSFIPFKVTNISGLINYGGEKIFFYDQNNNLIGECSDSLGNILNLGDIDFSGNDIGCNLGYWINKDRKYDYIMYKNNKIPIKYDIKDSFIVTSLYDYRKNVISANTDFSNFIFSNVYLHLNSFSNNSVYDYIILNFNNSFLSANLNYSVNQDCMADKIILGSNSILDNIYASNVFNNYTIYVCANDVNGDSSQYSFDIFISNLTGNLIYEFNVIGIKNSRPSLSNVSISKSEVYWGENFSIFGNFKDIDGDFVNITLEIFNPKTSEWIIFDKKSFSKSSGEFNFSNISVSSDYIDNINYYKFLLEDIDNVSSTKNGETFSNIYQFKTKLVSLNISDYFSSNNDFISVFVSNVLNDSPLNSALCKFYINISGNYVLYDTSFTNLSGVCSVDISQLNPGYYQYYVIVEKEFYEITKSDIFNVLYKKNLSLLVDIPKVHSRTMPLNISARLVDSSGIFVLEENVNCVLYVDDKLIVSTSTDSNGVCNFPSDLLNKNGFSAEDFSVGNNSVKLEISGLDTSKYVVSNFVYLDIITLIDQAVINITSPINSQSFDPSEIINLNATVLDSFGNVIDINNDFYWEYLEVDTNETSIISSKLEDDWIIPSDIYGAVDLRAIFNNPLYGGKIIEIVPISVTDGLRIRYEGNNKLLRKPSNINTLEAQILTGNGIPVNESSYNGTWGGYNCTWKLSNYNSSIVLGNSFTNSEGHCFYDLLTDCSYNVGDYNITVELSGNINPDYPILSGSDIQRIIFYDDLSSGFLNIDNLSFNPDREKLYYGEEYSFSTVLIDSCGKNSNQELFDVEWSYISEKDNFISSLGTEKNLSLIPLSYMNGDSKIRLRIINNSYYSSIFKDENVTFIKVANLNLFDIPEYVPKNTDVSLECGVSIPGILDKSFYEITFNIDGNIYTVPTSSNGIATYIWNPGNVGGKHYVSCSISNYSSSEYNIVVGSNSFLEKYITVPEDLLIYNSSIFVSNREYFMERSSPENIVFPDGMNSKMVFRKSLPPMYEPDKLYLGISYATVGAPGTIYEGKQVLLDGVNVTARIYNNNTNAFVDSVSCIQNLEEYNSRTATDPKDLIDYYKKNYVCIFNWNPGNVPVGVYKIIINATMPGQEGWTSEQYVDYFEVWGILNVSIERPYNEEDVVVNQNYNFKAIVKDEFGNVLDSGDVQVDYGTRDASWNCGDSSLGVTSLSGSDTDFTFIDKLETVGGGYITSVDRTYHDWRIQAEAKGNFYESHDIWTTYVPVPKSWCEYFYLQRLFHTEVDFRPNYPSEASFVYPINSVMAPDETGDYAGKLSFACKLKTYDNKFIKYVPVTLSCDGCSSIPGGSETKSTSSDGIAYFYYDPVSSDFDKKFNFSCKMSNYRNGNGNLFYSISNQTKAITVVEELGSGWGDLPDNYTFVSFDSIGIYTDSSCTNSKQWFKSSETNNLYIGFVVSKGSEDLSSYVVSKSVGSASGGSFTDSPDPASGSFSNPDSATICTQFIPEVKSGGVNLYKFSITVYDATGVDKTKYLNAYIDDVSPIISDVYTDKSYYTPADSVTATIEMNPNTVNVDGFADLLTIRYSQDTSYNLYFNKISEELWKVNFNAPSTAQQYDYNVKVTDKAGYYDEKIPGFSFIVDDQDPSMSYDLNSGCFNPRFFGEACKETVDFSISATDDNLIKKVEIKGSGSIGVIYTQDNINSGSFDSGTISKNIWSVNDGNYTITYTVEDYAGNKKVETDYLFIDKTGPDLSQVVADKQYIKDSTEAVTFSGLVTENLPIKISSITLDGVSITSCSFPTDSCYLNEVKNSGWSVGQNIVSIVAQDTLSNTNSKVFTIYYDDKDPIVNITLPNSNDYLSGNIEIKATVQDDYLNNNAVTYTFGSCSGNLNKISANEFSIVINSESCVSDGSNTITVSAEDLSGRVGSDNVDVIIDNEPPIVSITNPLNDSVVEGLITVTADVNELNLDKTELKIDSDSYVLMSCSGLSPNYNCEYNFDTNTKSDGNHVINVKAYDLAGNIKIATGNFKVDNNPPLINIDSLVNSDGTTYTSNFDNIYVSGVIEIKATIVDAAGEGVPSTYDCYLDGIKYDSTLVLGNQYKCFINTSEVSDGLKLFKFVANDNLGHNNEVSFNLNVDNTKPNFIVYDISPNIIKTGDVQTYEIVSNEDLKGTCKIYYSNTTALSSDLIIEKDVSVDSCQGTYNMNFGGSESGVRYIVSEITDLAGNKNNMVFEFYLDNFAPSIVNFNITSAMPPVPATNNLPGVSPIDNMTWVAEVIENTGKDNITELKMHAISGININSSKFKNFIFVSGNNYTLTEYPNYFSNGGALENETVFELITKDFVGNINKTSFTVFISNAPPSIDFVGAVPNPVEVNVENVNIIVNVSGSPVEVDRVNVTIISPSGKNTSQIFEDNGFILGHIMNYIPKESGLHDVKVITTNKAGKNTVGYFPNLFNAIGKTEGVINYTPSIINVPYSYLDNPYKFNLTIFLNNTGLARMLSSKIIFSGENIKTNLTNSIYECGTISANSYCMFNVEIIVENIVGSGEKRLFMVASWENVDYSSGFSSNNLLIIVNQSKKINVITDEIVKNDLEKSITQSIDGFYVRNEGNNELKDIIFTPYNGSLNSSDLHFSFSPSIISNLGINKNELVIVNVSSINKGNYNGYLKVNSSCSYPNCIDYLYMNLTFYDKAKQDILFPNNNDIIYRDNNNGILPFICKLTSNYDGSNLNNYSAEVILVEDGIQSILAKINTSIIGEVNYSINLSTIEPGEISLICKGVEDNNKFIKGSNYGNNEVNITLKGKLKGNLNFNYPSSCFGTLYWYDTHICNNINLSIIALDEFGYSLSNVNVTFYSNATQSKNLEIIGSCITDLSGICDFNWNPDVNVQGDYIVIANFSKNSYFDSNSVSKNITILGGYYVEINSPLDDTLNYNNTYILNLSVKDIDGSDITDTLSYNVSWSLHNQSGDLVEFLSTNKTFSWFINESYLGYYLLNVTIDSANGTVSDVNNITIIRDTLKLNLLENSNYEIFRESDNITDILNTTLKVEVIDSATNLPVQNSVIIFKLNSFIIGNCSTNNFGICSIIWDPSSNLEAGIYNITILAKKEFYKTVSLNTTNLIKVYIEPVWLSSETYSDGLNNNFDIPLACEIIESYKPTNNPLDKFKVDFKKLEPGLFNKIILSEIPVIDGIQYVWNSTNANNVTSLGLNKGLKIEFDNFANVTLYEGKNIASDVNVSGIDTVLVIFDNLSSTINWSLKALDMNDTLIDLILNSNKSIYEKFIGKNKFKNIILELRGNSSSVVVLDRIIFKETINTRVLDIGKRDVFGSDLSDLSLWGDMEHFVSEDPTIGFSSPNYKVSLESSIEYSYDKSKSLKMNFDNLLNSESAILVWKAGGIYDISKYKSMFFAIKNPDNLSLSLVLRLNRDGCFESYDIGNLSNTLYYPDVNISKYISKCGSNIKNITFIFKNVGNNPLNGDIYLDRFEVMADSYTSNGISSIDFHPFEAGYYRFSCGIKSNSRYVARRYKSEKVIKVIDSGASSDVGVESGGQTDSNADAASDGSVLSFELDKVEGNYIVPYDGFGKIETVTIFNNLNNERSFNITSNSNSIYVSNYGKTSVVIELAGDNISKNTFNIYLNSTNISTSTYETNLVITDINTKESVKFPIKLYLVNISVTSSLDINKTYDLMPLESINLLTNLKFNGSTSSKLKDFNYELFVGNNKNFKKCLNNGFEMNNGVLSLYCFVPFVNSGESYDLKLRTTIGGTN